MPAVFSLIGTCAWLLRTLRADSTAAIQCMPTLAPASAFNVTS